MKLKIVKYIDKETGKIVDILEDRLNHNTVCNIIEKYEIKVDDSNETDLKIKHATGNYILIWNNKFNSPYGWKLSSSEKLVGYSQTKLIHNKHKDILEAYLKNPSVEIECTNNISKDVDIETIWYSEENFIENYDENLYYVLKDKIPVWYEDENMIGKLVFNSEFNNFDIFEGRNNRTIKCLFSEYDLEYAKDYLRPATESEVLSLVYKPQQKISKENPSN